VLDPYEPWSDTWFIGNNRAFIQIGNHPPDSQWRGIQRTERGTCLYPFRDLAERPHDSLRENEGEIIGGIREMRLTNEDITTFHRIVSILTFTIDQMAKIDEIAGEEV